MERRESNGQRHLSRASLHRKSMEKQYSAMQKKHDFAFKNTRKNAMPKDSFFFFLQVILT